MGSAADVDKAVTAARRAFESYSQTTREERIALLQKIIAAYQAKYDEIAEDDLAARWARRSGCRRPRRPRSVVGHFNQTIEVLKSFEFEEKRGKTQIVARAGRRLRPDHAVELADQPDRVQGRAGARGGLHDRAEADAKSRR